MNFGRFFQKILASIHHPHHPQRQLLPDGMFQHVSYENKKSYSDNLFLINFGYSTKRFLLDFGYSTKRLILIFQAADRDNENAVLLTIGVLSDSGQDHLKRRFLHFAGIDLICQRVQGFHTFFNELLAS